MKARNSVLEDINRRKMDIMDLLTAHLEALHGIISSFISLLISI